MGTRLTNTGKENNTSNTTTVWDHIIALEEGVKLKDNISVDVTDKRFGAKGDGITDDTTAIQSAITYSLTNNKAIYFPPGTYLVTSTFSITQNVTILGVPGISIIKSDVKVFDIVGTQVVSTTIPATDIGSNVTPISLTGFTKDMLIVMKDTSQQWQVDPRTGVYFGETNIVKGVSTSLDLWIPTSSHYNDGTNIYGYNQLTSVYMNGLTFKRINKTANDISAVGIGYTQDAIFENITCEGWGYAGISEFYCVGTKYEKITARDGFYSSIGLGYGISLNSGIMSRVLNCHFYNTRRGIDFTGDVPHRFSDVSNSTSIGSKENADDCYGFGSHGSSEYIKYSNCRALNVRIPFLMRGNYFTLENCEIDGSSQFGVVISNGKGHRITNLREVKDSLFNTNPYGNSYGVYVSSPDFGLGRDSLIIKNSELRANDSILYFAPNAVCPSTIFEHNECHQRLGTTVTVKTDNQATAQTYTILAHSNKVDLLATGADLLPTKTQGTNGTVVWKNSNLLMRYNAPPIGSMYDDGEIAVDIYANSPFAFRYYHKSSDTWFKFGQRSISKSTSANRPSTLTSEDIGYFYFDTNLSVLGKPIRWNGSAWIDANGVYPENVGINTVVSVSATSLTVTLPKTEINNSYMVEITPAWNTNYWISAKSTTSFIVNFGTAPSGVSTLDWAIRR